MNAYTGWLSAVQDTEDATAVALRARDHLLALHTWLGWQVKRGRVDSADGAAALADVQTALDAVLLLLHACRAHRGGLKKPEG